MNFFLVFFLIFSFSFGQNQNIKTLSWKENRPLAWKDFRGKPKVSTNAAALTASGVSFGFSIGKTGKKITDFNTNVECVFYPTESWYKDEDANPHILRHEQIHFDITELFTRKFRQQISELRASPKIKNQLNSLYKAISKASSKMQNLYDEETNHSINKVQQKKWDDYIVAELRTLEAFKTK